MDLDSYSYHEAIDRTYIFAAMLEDYLQNHPVFKENKKQQKKIKKAIKLLSEVYQEISDIADNELN